ncbi:MAG TPA: hypothetical protein PLY87_17050 [Planctomycetaceae bacterium]|nr:hypothetical protein [Planctomycetaceae bacterium]HQZ66805.1 hypothetical protein [Planctomycetaceae bacterium]
MTLQRQPEIMPSVGRALWEIQPGRTQIIEMQSVGASPDTTNNAP